MQAGSSAGRSDRALPVPLYGEQLSETQCQREVNRAVHRLAEITKKCFPSCPPPPPQRSVKLMYNRYIPGSTFNVSLLIACDRKKNKEKKNSSRERLEL